MKIQQWEHSGKDGEYLSLLVWSDILFLERTEVVAADSAAADSVASAISAYAISGKKFEICLKNSTLLAGQQVQFPLVGEASVFSLGSRWLQLEC